LLYIKTLKKCIIKLITTVDMRFIFMIIAGIMGQQGKVQTANLINLILTSTGKKVSVIDSRSLTELDSCLVKSYLGELKKNNTDILILKIDANDIKKQLFAHIHFDIMIYTDKADDFDRYEAERHQEIMRWIFSAMSEKGMVIVNLDDRDIVNVLQEADKNIVTYGFNSKASITTSSIGDTASEDTFICCLQKTIATQSGSVVEPQEYRINVEPDEYDRHSVLAAATFAIINGIDLNTFRYSPEKVDRIH